MGRTIQAPGEDADFQVGDTLSDDSTMLSRVGNDRLPKFASHTEHERSAQLSASNNSVADLMVYAPVMTGAVLFPLPVGSALAAARRARGLKQAHAAELLGVAQPTISRIERGQIEPMGKLRARLLDLLAAHLDPVGDAALRRLVEGAAFPVHLVCDLSHRLLVASRPREREWRRPVAELLGAALWRYASDDIRAAEATLPGLGWGERGGAAVLEFDTGANATSGLRIAPATLAWERVILSDGAPARLVSSLASPARRRPPVSGVRA